MSTSISSPVIPDDTKALIASLRQSKTVTIMGGGSKESGLGDAALAARGEKKESTDLDVHNARFARFCDRWRRWCDMPGKSRLVDRLAGMTTDMRVWEAAKARIDPNNVEYRGWFFALTARSRFELVQQELERIASERRFRMRHRQWYHRGNM